jgi:hypothetical protein
VERFRKPSSATGLLKSTRRFSSVTQALHNYEWVMSVVHCNKSGAPESSISQTCKVLTLFVFFFLFLFSGVDSKKRSINVPGAGRVEEEDEVRFALRLLGKHLARRNVFARVCEVGVDNLQGRGKLDQQEEGVQSEADSCTMLKEMKWLANETLP